MSIIFTATTFDVRVTVQTKYQPNHSNTLMNEYMFAYKIKIENNADYAIQLLRRHWIIVDSNGETREVEGEGVIGLQPVIEPGGVHEYVSGCSLKTDMGKMYGSYLFERPVDGRNFEVRIPEFVMVMPDRLN